MSAFPEVDPVASGLHAQWYGANVLAGALTAQRCGCGRFRNPARFRCADCGSDDWSFESVGPEAIVESFTVTRRPVHPGFADVVPYAIVIAVTAENVRYLLQWRGNSDSVGIGDRVVIAVDRFGVPFAGPIS